MTAADSTVARGEHYVRSRGLRLAQLFAGLALFGISISLLVRARLGLDPWDVLHQGLARRTGLQIGWIVDIVGAIVLLAWIPLRQQPGFGTVANVIVVGIVTNAVLSIVPTPSALVLARSFLRRGSPSMGLRRDCTSRRRPWPRTTRRSDDGAASLRLVRSAGLAR